MLNAGDKASFVVAAVLILAGVAVPAARPAFAQGLTGASVEVSVVTSGGAPVPGAIVTLTESASGAGRKVTTGRRGADLF